LTLLGIAAAVVALIVWTVVGMVRGPQVVEHVLPQQAPYGLPPEATDVCYITRPAFWPNLAFEFSVSEESFVAWAKASGYELKEVSTPYRIYRYKAFAGNHRDDGQATISDGLFYEKMSEPDAGIHVAYDRLLKRAFWWAHTR
jgi:hypothetical protein